MTLSPFKEGNGRCNCSEADRPGTNDRNDVADFYLSVLHTNLGAGGEDVRHHHGLGVENTGGQPLR
jgi:hypothetical protein